MPQVEIRPPAYLQVDRPADPADAILNVTFYMDKAKDEVETAKQGHPIFKEIPHVRIAIPGDRDVVTRPVWDDGNNPLSDTYRFATKWQRFLEGQHEPVVGTPLSEWPGVTRSQVEELKYFQVLTVEAMAEVPDVSLAKMGAGYLQLRQKARDYLATAAKAAPAAQMRAELEVRDGQIAALQSQLSEMAAAMKQSAETKRGPGRPAKES